MRLCLKFSCKRGSCCCRQADGAQPDISTTWVTCPTTWIDHISYKWRLKHCLVFFFFHSAFYQEHFHISTVSCNISLTLINVPSLGAFRLFPNFLFCLNFSLRFLSISLKWSLCEGHYWGKEQKQKQAYCRWSIHTIILKGLMWFLLRCVWFMHMCTHTLRHAHVHLLRLGQHYWTQEYFRDTSTWPHETKGFNPSTWACSCHRETA